MNRGLYLTMEADFVDNCLGEENKTEAVVKTDAKGQMEGGRAQPAWVKRL